MKSFREINRFITIFLAIYLPFILIDSFLGYQVPFIGKIFNYCYHLILQFVMPGSVLILKAFGYHVMNTYDIIWIKGASRSVQIGHVCLAMDIMVIFSALIIAYPGHKKSKYWVIPVGCLLIQIINCFRMALLTESIYKRPESFDFEHHYLFKFASYLLIFIIWALWVRFFPAEGKKAKS